MQFEDALGNSAKFKWFVGLVEDRNDPLQIGRVKVRCFGVHTYDITQLPTADLPWASVMFPTSASGVNGIMTPMHGLTQGSTVVGFFLDGDSAQYPFVIGTMIGQQPEKKENPTDTYTTLMNYINHFPGESDINVLGRDPLVDNAEVNHGMISSMQATRALKVETAQGAKLTQVSGTAHSDDYFSAGQWSEPAPRGGRTFSGYATNRVTETESGHVMEFDDTMGNERVLIYHTNGSFTEYGAGGQVVQKVVGKGFEINLQDKNVYIHGDYNLTVNGDMRHLVRGNYFLEVVGDYRQLIHQTMSTKISEGNEEKEIFGYQSIFVGADGSYTTNGEYTITTGSTYTQHTNGDCMIEVSGLAPIFSVSAGLAGTIQLSSLGNIDITATIGAAIKGFTTEIGSTVTPGGSTLIYGTSLVSIFSPGVVSSVANGVNSLAAGGAAVITGATVTLN